MSEQLVRRIKAAISKYDAYPLSKAKNAWDKPEAKDKPNHARDRKKWAAARAAATKKYGTKNSYVKNQYAARLYGKKGGSWEKSLDSVVESLLEKSSDSPRGPNSAERLGLIRSYEELFPPEHRNPWTLDAYNRASRQAIAAHNRAKEMAELSRLGITPSGSRGSTEPPRSDSAELPKSDSAKPLGKEWSGLWGGTIGGSSKKSLDSVVESLLEKSAAWQRAEGKNPKGGLNAKGRASAKKEGHNLKPPVKSGHTLADLKRRYSFLSRMSGNPGPEHDENGKPTRLLLSLQVWGASSKADAKRKAAMLKRRIASMEGTS